MERSGDTAGVNATPQSSPEQSPEQPRLVFFYSETSGACRRTEADLAQVLQRRRNHSTFKLVRVSVDRQPDLAVRFGVRSVPTLVIVEGRRVMRRIVGRPSSRDLAAALEPWLR